MPLPNHNNSCFLNAAVQSLYQIKSIRNALETIDVSNNDRLIHLQKIFLEYPNDLSTPFRSIIYGKIAKNIRKSLKISETGQHDAIECFKLLLQELIDGTKTDNYVSKLILILLSNSVTHTHLPAKTVSPPEKQSKKDYPY